MLLFICLSVCLTDCLSLHLYIFRQIHGNETYIAGCSRDSGAHWFCPTPKTFTLLLPLRSFSFTRLKFSVCWDKCLCVCIWCSLFVFFFPLQCLQIINTKHLGLLVAEHAFALYTYGLCTQLHTSEGAFHNTVINIHYLDKEGLNSKEI